MRAVGYIRMSSSRAPLGQYAAALLLVLTPYPCLAEPFDTGWKTLNKQDFQDFQIIANDIKINNFLLNEGSSFFYGKSSVLEFSASAINRGNDKHNVSVQIIGVMADGSPSFALVAEPSFSVIQPGKSEEIKNKFLINPKAVGDAVSFTIRVIIN